MAKSAVLDPSAEVLDGVPDLPPPSGDAVSPQQSVAEKPQSPKPHKDLPFFSLLKTLKPAEWEKHIVYLYRRRPITDMTAGGTQKKYLAKYVAPFDESMVMAEFGSGEYKAVLNRAGAIVAEHVFEIENEKFPPRIPKGAWLDDPRNDKWAAWVKKADETAAPEPPVASAAAGITAQDQLRMMAFVRDMIKEFRPEAGDREKDAISAEMVKILPQLLKQGNDANDPSKLLAIVTQLIGMAAPKGDDTLVKLMLDQQRALETRLAQAEQRNTDLMMQLLDRREKEEKSPADQLADFAKLITAFRELDLGGGGSSRMSGWQEMLQPVLGGVAQAVAPVLPHVLMKLAPRPPLNPGVVNQPQFPPAVVPVEAAPPAPVNPAAVGVGSPTAMPQIDEAAAMQISFIASMAASALALGLPGDDFADKLEQQYGATTYEHIAAIPKDQLLQLLRAVPQAWQAIAPFEARLDDFITEFYAYGEPDPEPQPPAPESPAAAAEQPTTPETKKGRKQSK